MWLFPWLTLKHVHMHMHTHAHTHTHTHTHNQTNNSLTPSFSPSLPPSLPPLPQVLPNLLLRKWGDEELEANLQSLDDILQRVMSELGSWDMYKAEVLSGNLEFVFHFILFCFVSFSFLFFLCIFNLTQKKKKK